MTTNFAVTHIKTNTWYKENIKDLAEFCNISHNIDTRKTKKALGIKGAGKLKVFVEFAESEDFDERANPQIVYKYEVCCLPSHPLGVDGEWGMMSICPQGTAYVIFK